MFICYQFKKVGKQLFSKELCEIEETCTRSGIWFLVCHQTWL